MSITELGNKSYKNKWEIDYDPMFKHIDHLGDKLKKMNMLEVCKSVYAFCTVIHGINEEEYEGRVDNLNKKNLELFITTENQQRELVACRQVVQQYENQLISAGLLQSSNVFQTLAGLSKPQEVFEESATLSDASMEDILLSKSNAQQAELGETPDA